MRGSPDIPEIHPLPTPHYLHMVQTLQSVHLGMGDTFLHCFLPSPTPTHTPRAFPEAPWLESGVYRMMERTSPF